MRRFQRSRRNLPARPKRAVRQIFVPQAIWYASTNNGALKFSEGVKIVKDEEFTVKLDLGGFAVVRLTKGTLQTPEVPNGNALITQVSGDTITDGSQIINMTTRGGVRGPEGLTLGPFVVRFQGYP